MGTTGGWNRPSANQPTVTKKRTGLSPAVKGVVAGVVVILGAVFAYVCLVGDAANHPAAVETGKGRIKDKGAARRADEKGQVTATVNPRKTSAAAERKGTEVASDATVEDVRSDATSTNSVKREDKRLFKNPMDQLLAMALPRNPGDNVPPLPISDDMKFSEEEEKQILERLTADEKDSDRVLDSKEVVQALRDEYQEMKTKHGWTFIDYLKALQAKTSLDAEVKKESVKIHESIFHDKMLTDEEYNKALGEINKVLADRGIPPIGPANEVEPGEEPATRQEILKLEEAEKESVE